MIRGKENVIVFFSILSLSFGFIFLLLINNCFSFNISKHLYTSDLLNQHFSLSSLSSLVFTFALVFQSGSCFAGSSI